MAIGQHGFETADGEQGIHDTAAMDDGHVRATVMCDEKGDEPHITVEVGALDVALVVQRDARSLEGLRRWGRMLIAAADIAEHGNRPSNEGSA